MTAIASHRGGALLWPENSRIAFEATANLPVEQVEFDLHRSRDGRLVVIHDSTLDRTTDGTGPVGSHSWDELQRFVLKGANGQRVLLLEEVIEIFRPTRIGLRLELKAAAGRRSDPELPAAAAAALDKAGILDRTILTSFQLDTVKQAVARCAPSTHAWIISPDLQTDLGLPRIIDIACHAEVPMLCIHSARLDREGLSQIRDAGLEIGGWSCNEPSVIARMFEFAVDVFTTDRPDIAIAQRRAFEKRIPVSRIEAGLRVLVTAGAGGIGRAIVEALHAAGARLHICDVSRTALDEACAAFPGVTGSLADVAEESDVEHLFADVRQNLGGLDILVNNAGISGPTGGIEDLSPADWRRTIDVNLTGQFYCARLAVPMLVESGNGAIIHMASVAGRLGYAFRTPYAASKWGIIGLTESLARELGPRGIRVNAILPGLVEGPRMEGVIRSRAAQMGVSYTEMEKTYLEKVSLRRMVTASDVAEMVLFLCSPGGRNISGQSLSVCGNVEAL